MWYFFKLNVILCFFIVLIMINIFVMCMVCFGGVFLLLIIIVKVEFLFLRVSKDFCVFIILVLLMLKYDVFLVIMEKFNFLFVL